MTSLSAKFFEVFRALKVDAVPRAPRPETRNSADDVMGEPNNDNRNSEEPEEIFIEDTEEKPKHKKNVFGNKKKDAPEKSKTPSKAKSQSGNHVNTQATGYVINIIDSNKVRCGNDFIYHLGPSNASTKHGITTDDLDDEHVEKDNLITLLMEADITPTHEYIDYIAKNLGRKWHSFFRKLGYSKGRIETFEIDEARNGVSEARYKLLLDWVRNDDNGTLGYLATQLWDEGERHVVKELSIIYSKN